MARVLLVNAPLLPVHTLRRLFPHAPPTTLQMLSAVLKVAGHRTRIVDHQDIPLPETPLFQAIREFRPDIVGFSSTCMVDAEPVRELIRRTRLLFPRIRTVAGGQIPTFLPEFFLGPDGTECVVCYEGEATFPELVARMEAGRPIQDLAGIAYAGPDGSVVRTEERPPIFDLDSLPFPDREGSLHPSPYLPGLAATIETFRGCPHGCLFCSIPAFFRKPLRGKSPLRLLEELEEVKRLGAAEVFFTDDCFGTRPDQTVALAEGMLSRNIGLKFGVQIRADTIAGHPDMIRLLHRAGLFWVVVGFEAYRDRTLAGLDKGGHSGFEVNRKASALLRELDIVVMGTHIFAAPGTGLTDAVKTFYYGRKFSDLFRMTIYTPLLGSKLYAKLAKEGRIRTRSLSDFSYGNYVIHDKRSSFLTKAGFFGFMLAHYLAPTTGLACITHPNPIVRVLQRNAYAGAFRFVVGSLLSGWSRRAEVVR